MARNSLVVAAAPETVWAVLAAPRCYADWVVGSEAIRAWDPAWPAPGARFHHRTRAAVVPVDDDTEVLEAQPPRRLVLEARTRPLGTARVEIRIEPHPAGSLVTLVEDPVGLLAPAPLRPAAHALVRLRNGESLRRLRRLAEARALGDATAAGGRRRA